MCCVEGMSLSFARKLFPAGGFVCLRADEALCIVEFMHKNDIWVEKFYA